MVSTAAPSQVLAQYQTCPLLAPSSQTSPVSMLPLPQSGTTASQVLVQYPACPLLTPSSQVSHRSISPFPQLEREVQRRLSVNQSGDDNESINPYEALPVFRERERQLLVRLSVCKEDDSMLQEMLDMRLLVRLSVVREDIVQRVFGKVPWRLFPERLMAVICPLSQVTPYQSQTVVYDASHFANHLS